ncbi:MAG: hypothetical protein GX803_09095 [Lentisphaerae bacterium]|nr:hypothetical protein [Lentisphaerota bacterium]
MKILLFAAGQYDADIWMKKLFFIPVALRRDDSNPSAALFGVRRLSNQLHPACLASGPDLSRELSRVGELSRLGVLEKTFFRAGNF